MFDKDNKGQVIQEEAPTIMRYLGVYPSEKDIVKEVGRAHPRPHTHTLPHSPWPCTPHHNTTQHGTARAHTHARTTWSTLTVTAAH